MRAAMFAREKLFRVALLACAVLARGMDPAGAQTADALRGNDARDQAHFEESDRELSRVVADALQKIDAFAHPDTKAEAKDALLQAQRAFVMLRALDCQAASALMWLRSARTRAGYTASCMRELTTARIDTLKRRYLLNN